MSDPRLPRTFSRRGLMMGAAAVLAAKPKLATAGAFDDIGRDANPGPPYVYVGSYTPPGRGISIYHIDPDTNTLSLVNVVGPVASPSFLAMDSRKRFLYAGNEIGAGTVMAFSANSQSGGLTFLNSQSAGGSPAHVIVHPADQHVIAANYGGSSIEVLPIMSDGSLGAPTQLIRSIGELGPNTGRQEAPHPHMALPDSTGKFVLVNDLGLDATYVYSFDTSSGRMTQASIARATPGSGPRHLAWHPSGKTVYSINELNNSINVYSWDGNGNLNAVQNDLTTLPKGFQGTSACAEIQVHSNGKFLYASNRGHNSIVMFSIDPINAQLTLVGWTHTQGETPRYFGIDPSGNFLHVGHQNTGNIITFKIDQTNGSLTPSGQYVATGAPVSIVFAYPNS